MDVYMLAFRLALT